MGRPPDGATAKGSHLSLRLEPRLRIKIDKARGSLSLTRWVTLAIQEKLDRDR